MPTTSPPISHIDIGEEARVRHSRYQRQCPPPSHCTPRAKIMEKLLRGGKFSRIGGEEREMRGYSSCVRVSLVGIKPNSGDVLPVENWQDSPQGGAEK